MKILIIEDDLSHLRGMYAFLSQKGHEVRPEETGYRALKQSISRSFSPGIKTALSKEAANYIRDFIDQFNPDLVLVDYQLKENTQMVNGKRFIETFLAARNVLIVTGQPDGKVNNELKEMTLKSRQGAYRALLWKFDNLGDEFFNLLEGELRIFGEQSRRSPVRFEHG